MLPVTEQSQFLYPRKPIQNLKGLFLWPLKALHIIGPKHIFVWKILYKTHKSQAKIAIKCSFDNTFQSSSKPKA
jgi:hypothetical protein